jgi:oligoendopeptidase F
MNLLPFEPQPPFRSRRFVPQTLDIGDWKSIAVLFDDLETRVSNCGSPSDLEQWVLDWGELSAALDEESSSRYIAMTCHTDSAEAEKAYIDYVEQIEPKLKPRQFELARLYVAHPLCAGLPHPRFDVFDRDMKRMVELFRPENVSLETEEAKLSQQYQKLVGGLAVSYQGEELTLPQMARYLEDPQRLTRQEAWGLVAERRLREREKFDELFDGLIAVRSKIAANAGYANYRDYAFARLGRFDYTAEDCIQFHQAVETEVMPLVRELQALRRKQLGLESLRPWDLSVDPLNRPALKPFSDVQQMVARTQEVFDRLDGELASGFALMNRLRLLDLDNRKGKAPGGYQSTLPESRLPFIFMNAVGLQRDVETILHESGHAFHALAPREEDLYAYRNAPIEICEVASMSMELLGNEFIGCFYNDQDARRARISHLEGVVNVFPWIATVDAFQHWVYTHPGHSRQERSAAWMSLMNRFGGDVDWTGHFDARASLWHRQLHIFIHAFYYIEYGIAQLGALQIWANSKVDKAGALENYKKALSFGGSRPLPQLFAAAGCPFDFSSKTIAPLVALVRAELAKLRADA